MLSIEKQILYILSNVPALEVQELIRLYEERGYSPQSIRNILSRLKKEKFVDCPQRSTYQILDKGRQFVQVVNEKPKLSEQLWDGTWYIVMAEIPESERRKRDKFRGELLQLGFATFYKATYISPWNYTDTVQKIAASYDIVNNVTLCKAEFLCNEINREKAYKIWNLESLMLLYREKWKWFKETFIPSTEAFILNEEDPLKIFVQFLHLGEVISEIFLHDPMLPDELLPADWQGKRMLHEMYSYNHKLVERIQLDSYYAKFVK